MQPDSLPFALSPLAFNGDLSDGGFEGTRVLFFASLLFSQGGGMDLSKVGEKILSSVRSARSLGLIPPTSDRPEVIINPHSFDYICLSTYTCGFVFSVQDCLKLSLWTYGD